MKIAILAVLLLAGAATAFVFFYPEQAAFITKGTPLGEKLSTSTPLYKWQNARGEWQVTDEPPPAGVPYEVLRYNLDANVVPSLDSRQEH